MNTPKRNDEESPIPEKIIDSLKNKVLDWSLEQEKKKQAFSTLVVYERWLDKQWLNIDDNVSESIKTLSDELWTPNILTYESLVLLNDLEESPALFSQEFEKDERHFYDMHQQIEKHFYVLHQNIYDFYSWAVNEPDFDTINDCQKEIFSCLSRLVWGMSVAWFNGIRPYWSLDDYHQKDVGWKNFSWPSWAFSCGAIYLDILLWVKWTNLDKYSLDDRLLPQIQWNWYISVGDIEDLKELVNQHGNLFDLLWNSNQWAQKMLEQLKKYRAWHKNAAIKFIWKENLQMPWTGWSLNANDFLDDIKNKTILRIEELNRK